jgi:uncharacterized protein
VHALDLSGPRRLFTRCLLCNCTLQEVPPEQAGPLVPVGVLALAHAVRRCTACTRLYWDGSHVRRMRTALERALPGFPLEP